MDKRTRIIQKLYMAGRLRRFFIQPQPYHPRLYILNQKKHHKKKSFKEEYIALLEKFEIDYDERYLLKEIN